MADNEQLLVAVDGDVLRLTINRPEKRNALSMALLDELGQPLMSCTLIMPGEELPVTEAEDVRSILEHQVDLIIDGGHCGHEPTTVIRLNEGVPELRRQGKGQDHGLG